MTLKELSNIERAIILTRLDIVVEQASAIHSYAHTLSCGELQTIVDDVYKVVRRHAVKLGHSTKGKK